LYHNAGAAQAAESVQAVLPILPIGGDGGGSGKSGFPPQISPQTIGDCGGNGEISFIVERKSDKSERQIFAYWRWWRFAVE
jgi:hypothetical protein